MCLPIAGCFSPRIPEGSACTNVCPGDLTCVNGRCVRGGAEIDAGLDAALDAPLDAPAACPAGYLLNPTTGSNYRVVSTSANPATAVADCADDGTKTYLVIIDDLTENSVVDALANNDTWLGISDAVTEGTWVTVLGTPQIFFRWAQGQPDGGTDENCALLADAEWQDVACAASKPYVCECR